MKLLFTKELLKLEDESVIKKLFAVLEENKTNQESFEELPNKVQYGIKEAIEQADNGTLIAHETQQSKYKKYLK